MNVRTLIERAAKLAGLCVERIEIGASDQLEASKIGARLDRWRSCSTADPEGGATECEYGQS